MSQVGTSGHADPQREFSGLTPTLLIYTVLPRLVEFLFAKLSLSNP